MDLSLQAIDFLLASSIQDGWPLSDVDWHAGAFVGDAEGVEDDCTFFRNHLSSQGRSGTLTGLDSEQGNNSNKCDVAGLFGYQMQSLLCVDKPAGLSAGFLGSLISGAAVVSPTGRSSACAFVVSTCGDVCREKQT